jgi:uncharacterized membrane protein YccC
VATAATIVLWPTRHLDALRARAARACRALADLIEAGSSPGDSAGSAEAASDAVNDLRHSFVSTPLRPTRPTGPTEAVAFLVDALEWLYPIVAAAPAGAAGQDPCHDVNGEVHGAAAAVLRASAENLEDRPQEVPLERLDRASEAVEEALAHRIGSVAPDGGPGSLLDATEPSFRTRELASLTHEIGFNALRAGGAQPLHRGASAARKTLKLLGAHLTPTSASFRNSLRGAIGLAAAVAVIEIATVQHGFWVVLATLSVLRSTALGTGSTIVQALVGTVAGIAAGGLLLYAIGSNEAVLWGLLPVAILLAAYGARVLPLAVGQAGFTMTVLVIFNIIVPTGWQIGLVRVEDVAIGSAISLAVGLLFWPRGMEALLRRSLGAAYTEAAGYVAAATRRLAGADPGAGLAGAREEARDAADRLDDAFRQYLAEPSRQSSERDDLATLVSGATRVLLTAYSLSTLSPAHGPSQFARCDRELIAEADRLRGWYDALAVSVVRRQTISPPHADGDGSPVARCVTSSLPQAGDAGPRSALGLLWADHGVAELRRLATELAEPAGELARSRR